MAVLPDNKNDKNLSNHILLLNRIDIQNILNLPLKATQRIKVRFKNYNIYILTMFLTICIGFQYTCCEVSRNFVILGASSGGLYVFRRQPCEFIQLLPNKVSVVNSIIHIIRNQNDKEKIYHFIF